MRVSVFGPNDDFPLGLSEGRDGKVLVVDWMPEGMKSMIEVPDDTKTCDDGLAKIAVAMTRHATALKLIEELKQVIGPDWAKGLKGLVEREEAKEGGC